MIPSFIVDSSTQQLVASSRPPVRHFIPGPSWVAPEVLAAQARTPLAHRSEEFRAIYQTVSAALQGVFRTRAPVVTATASATLLMEAAVASTVTQRVLNLVCGAFSKRWHDISLALGREADMVAVPYGEAVAPELVRAALERKQYEAVTVVHSETSTGVLNPLAEIAAVVREGSEALVLVDAVSSLGGAPVETDAWSLDVVLTASQKALALPPGLAFAAVSKRAEGRMESVPRRGFYTDLARYLEAHRRGGTLSTPAVTLFFAAQLQLARIESEGLEARWRRHRALQERSIAWARERGLGLPAAAGFRSPTVSALGAPAGVSAPALVRELSRRGWKVGSGYGEWRESSFRIGHMGDVQEPDLEALLDACDQVLAQLGHRT